MAEADDRRSEPRYAVSWEGLLFVGDHRLPCTLLEESDSGLRIRLSAPRPVAGAVQVLDRNGGRAMTAQVVWVRSLEVGLRVTGKCALNGFVPPAFRKIREVYLQGGRAG